MCGSIRIVYLIKTSINKQQHRVPKYGKWEAKIWLRAPATFPAACPLSCCSVTWSFNKHASEVHAVSMPRHHSSPARLLSAMLSLWSGHLSTGSWTVTSSSFYTGLIQLPDGDRPELWWVQCKLFDSTSGKHSLSTGLWLLRENASRSQGFALIWVKEEKDLWKANE